VDILYGHVTTQVILVDVLQLLLELKFITYGFYSLTYRNPVFSIKLKLGVLNFKVTLINS